MNAEAQDKLIRRLRDKILRAVDRITMLEDKILRAVDRITMLEEEGLEDADVVVLSYGITSRVAQRAVELARAKGLKVGKLRMITVWPFPEDHIRMVAARVAARVKAFVVPEINMGQIVREVERVAAGRAKAIPVPHAGGSVHRPEDILQAIEEAAK